MASNKKEWYYSRTVWVAIAQAILGILTAALAAEPELQQVGSLLLLKSAADLLLRALTNKPLNL